MSEQTPDRLQQFRAQYAPPRKNGALAYVQLAVTTAGFVVVGALLLAPRNAAGPAAGGMSPDEQREFAAYLEGKSEPEAAVQAYETYMKNAALDPAERANVAYSIAKLSIDAELYDQALPYLYQAEFLNPESDLKDEINKKVVMCLDKLGRGADLRHELRKRTEIKRSAKNVEPDETVLAEFAGEVLTDRDLENELDKLPPAARDSMNTPENRADMVKSLVAQRLLLDKARRLELDKDPEIQDQLVKQLDSMIVQKLIQDEVKKNIKISPEDVERFYKAEPARFTDPAVAEIQIADAESEDAAKAITEFDADPVKIRKGGPVPGAPRELDASAVFETEEGKIAGPVQCGERWYVFKVNSKQPEKLRPFEEVKDAARRMLQMQKEQEQVSALIEETLQARNVKLHLDRLQQAPRPASKPAPQFTPVAPPQAQ